MLRMDFGRSSLWKWNQLDTIENMAADKLSTKKNQWKSQGAKSSVKRMQLIKKRVDCIVSVFQGG